MVVLYFADIFGKPGRRAVAGCLSDLKAIYSPDFVIGNAENLAGGRGVNRRTFQEMRDLGFDGMTSGNHIWDNKEVLDLFAANVPLIRPANYPSLPGEVCPGKGYTLLRVRDKGLLVINLMGRVFMGELDCPFRTVDKILDEQKSEWPILVDMHAEASSEKYAMGWHLAGRVSAVVGSHTHIQSADERILPGGTAYISDVGLTGSFDSVIGLRPEGIIKRFITKRLQPTTMAKENPIACAVVIKIGHNNKAESIERVSRLVTISDLHGEGRDLE